jgi:uncharacterized protein YdhG (YjbR/CyaY superfamily)
MNSPRAVESVDAYIGRAPVEAREKLSQLRAIFRKVAPRADEAISYNMPFYYHHGPLGGFAAYKDHVSLFGTFSNELREELKPYKSGRGSVQFPIDEPLPVHLVSKLVKAHLRMNEARAVGVGRQ